MLIPVVPNGHYLIDHLSRIYVFRLTSSKDRDRRPGTQVIALQVQKASFSEFGFVAGNQLESWPRSKMGRKVEDAVAVLLSSDFRVHGRAYAIENRRCYHCNRELLSSVAGLHDECTRNLSVMYGDLSVPTRVVTATFDDELYAYNVERFERADTEPDEDLNWRNDGPDEEE